MSILTQIHLKYLICLDRAIMSLQISVVKNLALNGRVIQHNSISASFFTFEKFFFSKFHDNYALTIKMSNQRLIVRPESFSV